MGLLQKKKDLEEMRNCCMYLKHRTVGNDSFCQDLGVLTLFTISVCQAAKIRFALLFRITLRFDLLQPKSQGLQRSPKRLRASYDLPTSLGGDSASKTTAPAHGGRGLGGKVVGCGGWTGSNVLMWRG